MTTAGSMCSGYGGLDLAIAQVLGARPAWLADNDPAASRVLAARFPGVPNLGDITTADWAAAEPVDILSAGWPCQPVSAAGRRKGTADERWLFDDICAAVGRMDPRPRLFVFENVTGLLSVDGGHAMARVVHGLAGLGYVGQWGLARASAAGAAHRRERVFGLAWPADAGGARPQGRHGPGQAQEGRQAAPRLGCGPAVGAGAAADPDGATGRQRRQPAPGQAEGRRSRADAGRRGGVAPRPRRPAADAAGQRREQRLPEAARQQGRDGAARPGAAAAADPGGIRRDRGQAGSGAWRHPAIGQQAGHHARHGAGVPLNWGRYSLAIRRWERATGRAAPRPVEPARTGERLSPWFVEWLMGLPEGWVCAVPGLSRPDQLRVLGNGVVPQQAALALRLLLDRAGWQPAHDPEEASA